MEQIKENNDNLFGQIAKQKMKQQWIRKQLKICKSKYTHPKSYNLFCGTWNVNGRARVDEEGLSDWLFPKDNDEQDIFAIGFQEIVELTPVNVAVDPMGPQRTQFWLDRIDECFKKETNVKYVKLCSKSLVGILLCIYVRESLISEVNDLRFTTTAVGVMGVMGNKGGVVIRFNLHSTSICFICTHLAASRNNVEARNSDYRNILEKSLLLPLSDEYYTSNESQTLMEKCTSNQIENTAYTILEHDLIFWIGDLNYRIDVSLNLEDIMELLSKENYLALRKKDQLNIERALGNVFEGFEEAPLNFPPTYKFQPNTDNYEVRPEKKLRPPAWCDRILWRYYTDSQLQQQKKQKLLLEQQKEEKEGEKVDGEGNGDGDDNSNIKDKAIEGEEDNNHQNTLTTNSVPFNHVQEDNQLIQIKNYRMSNLKPSDHKPVSGSFTIETRVVDNEKEKVEYMRLVRELDRMENEVQPKVEVGPLLDLQFQTVRFQERKHAVFFITNVGNSIANWRFVPKNDDTFLAGHWIHVEPSLGMVAPGENIRVTVEVFVDYRSLDLVANALGSDFIPHNSSPSPITHAQIESEDNPNPQRLDSEDEEKTLNLTQENNSSNNNNGDNDGYGDDDETEVEPIQLAKPKDKSKTISILLQDFLILRIENGRDYFLTITADFAPTMEDINTMQIQKAQIEAIAAIEELRGRNESNERKHSVSNQSSPPKSTTTPFNKLINVVEAVKHSEQTEKLIHDGKEIVKKFNLGLKSVKEKASSVAGKLSHDSNDNNGTAHRTSSVDGSEGLSSSQRKNKLTIPSILSRRNSKTEQVDHDNQL